MQTVGNVWWKEGNGTGIGTNRWEVYGGKKAVVYVKVNTEDLECTH